MTLREVRDDRDYWQAKCGELLQQRDGKRRFSEYNDELYDYLSTYQKLNRVAAQADRSEMNPATHREFITLIQRAQQIVRLEAAQAGLPLEGSVTRWVV